MWVSVRVSLGAPGCRLLVQNRAEFLGVTAEGRPGQGWGTR